MRRVKVGDVLELQRRPVEIVPGDEYVLIGLYSFGKGIFHRNPRLGADLGDYKFSEVVPGDLVVSNIQAWEGAVGYATNVDRNTIGTHRFLCYTARNDAEIDTNWARHYFLSSTGFPQIQTAAPGSVTRNRTLAQARFEAIEIPLPDIDDQRRTAARLDGVSSTLRRIENFRSVARTMSDALPSALATKPQLSESARLASGWVRLPLGEVMEQSTESVDVALEGRYPNLGVYSFGRGVFAKPPIDGMETSAKRLNRVRAAQFIFSRLFAFEGAYTFVPNEFDGYFVSKQFPCFDVDPSLSTAEFIAAALRSPQQWRELARSSKGLGLRRQTIKVEALLDHELWFPPISEQHRIVDALQKLDQVRGLLKSSSSIAASVLPSALNRAFAGLV